MGLVTPPIHFDMGHTLRMVEPYCSQSSLDEYCLICRVLLSLGIYKRPCVSPSMLRCSYNTICTSSFQDSRPSLWRGYINNYITGKDPTILITRTTSSAGADSGAGGSEAALQCILPDNEERETVEMMGWHAGDLMAMQVTQTICQGLMSNLSVESNNRREAQASFEPDQWKEEAENKNGPFYS